MIRAGVAGAGAQEPQECRWCPRCPPHPARCTYSTSAADEHFYRLDNGTVVQVSSTPQYVKLWCGAGAALEAASLPRFPYLVRAPRVILRACPPPRADYARALAALNVSAPAQLVLQALPAAPALRPDHLAGLALTDLALLGAGGAGGGEPTLPADLLTPLGTLRTLHLQAVRAPPGLRLPRGLRVLRAAGAGLGALLGRDQLAALSELRALVLTDPALSVGPPLHAALALRHVTLYAPLTALPVLAHLHNFTIVGALNLTLGGACGGLLRLRVERPRRGPPAAWLASCTRLQVLELVALPPGALPADLLSGAPGAAATLTALTLQRCLLTDLPAALLAPTRRLRSLHLTHNRLQHLDRYAFAQLSHLEELDLSVNLLTAAAVQLALAPVSELRVLRLADNPLGDLCAPPAPAARLAAPAPSGLRHLLALRELSLAGTGATQLCADWRRELRALRRLDLRHNNITELQYSDLEWVERAGGAAGGGRAAVDLSGNPVRALVVSPADYERAAAHPAGATTVEVEVTSAVSCDCTMYWFAQALRARLLPAAFPRALLCEGGRPLALLDPRDMVCAASVGCPAGCGCSWRAWDAATVVRCAGAGLAALPALPAASRLVLLAADNRITGDTLPAHLPPALQELDLSGNMISDVTPAAARALLAAGRRVRLARNPLSCRCDAALMQHMRAHEHQVVDYAEAECAESGAVTAAAAACGAGAGGARAALAGAGGALLAGAALVAGGAVLARRHARLRLKAFLLARGLCVRWARPPDDDGCKYDVFLSYCHRDSAVAEQVVSALEGGPRPLTLCLHHRDWRAGDWIPAQIARSVAESRRTVVLLSEHFARSAWARAEFREAAARAMRADTPTLVVVVLGAGPPPSLDPELAHYVRNNTYVRWGDPAFWEKLRLALPAPRDPPAPPRARPTLRPHARPPLPAPRPPPAPVHRPRLRPRHTLPPPTPHPHHPPPPTPVVKFSPLQFPAVKDAPVVTSPCA